MSEVILDDDNFQSEVKNFVGIVLVDFWAIWCSPCLMQGPIVEKLARKYAGDPNIKITKLNIDEAGAIGEKLKIRSIPTLMFFKNGAPAATFIGVTQLEVLENKLLELIKA